MGFQDAAGNPIRLERGQNGVVTILIDRPQKKNALDFAMWRTLAEMVDELAADAAVRALVLGSAGPDFSAGADIAEFDSLRGEPDSARTYEAANSAAFAALRDAPFPTLAAISGICFGGGFGLAAACDMRIASQDARFAVPAARLGLAYPVDAMADIVHALGPQLARHLTFTGASIGAERALAVGFLLELAEAPLARAGEIAATIAANAPLSVRASKAAIAAVLSGGEADVDRAIRLGDATFSSADYEEGRAAFKERRTPRFNGA